MIKHTRVTLPVFVVLTARLPDLFLSWFAPLARELCRKTWQCQINIFKVQISIRPSEYHLDDHATYKRILEVQLNQGRYFLLIKILHLSFISFTSQPCSLNSSNTANDQSTGSSPFTSLFPAEIMATDTYSTFSLIKYVEYLKKGFKRLLKRLQKTPNVFDYLVICRVNIKPN